MTLSKARPLHRRRSFQGLDISVENQCGSYRCWKDPHAGTEGRTLMQYDYGYIRGTKGTDGDHVDVYVGPNKNATHAYVVTQMKAPFFMEIDEQKVMLGFDNAEDAEAAYKMHYDNPRFFGSMRAVPMGDFRAQVLNKENHGQLVKSADGSLTCPHCTVTVFRAPKDGEVLKARTSIVVLHKSTGLIEINCHVCRQPITFTHGQPMAPSQPKIEVDRVVKSILVLDAPKRS